MSKIDWGDPNPKLGLKSASAIRLSTFFCTESRNLRASGLWEFANSARKKTHQAICRVVTRPAARNQQKHPTCPSPDSPFRLQGNFNNFRKCSRVWAIVLIFPKFLLKYTFRWINFPRSPRKSLPGHREGRVTIAGPITRNSRATTDSTRRSSAYIEQDTFQCPSVRVPRPADASRHPHRRRLRTCR